MYKGGQIPTNDLNSVQVANHGVLKYPFTLNLYVPYFYIEFYGILILALAMTFHHYTT